MLLAMTSRTTQRALIAARGEIVVSRSLSASSSLPAATQAGDVTVLARRPARLSSGTLASMPGQHVVTWDDETPKSLSIMCGHCGKGVEANRISKAVEVKRWDEPPGFGQFGVIVSATYLCPRAECHSPSLVFMEFRNDLGDTSGGDIVAQLPRGRPEPMEGLPAPIESVRAEAWSCYYGGDFRAAIVMGRAAVQRAVRTLGGKGRDLYHEIDDLREQGVVTEELKDWAHEVRLAAREAAHPEELGDVSHDEALESLRFADDFLRFAVALPAKRKANKAVAP